MGAPDKGFRGTIAYGQITSSGGVISGFINRQWNPIKYTGEIVEGLGHNVIPYINTINPSNPDQFGFRAQQSGTYRIFFQCNFMGGYVHPDKQLIFWGAFVNEADPDASSIAINQLQIDSYTLPSITNIQQLAFTQGTVNLNKNDYLTFGVDAKTMPTTDLSVKNLSLTVYNLNQLGAR